MPATRRVLVLTTDTGAGHRSVSNALVQGARAQPERGLELVDIDVFSPLPPRKDGPPESLAVIDRFVRLYGPIIVHAPWLWGLTFGTADHDLGLNAFLAGFGALLTRRIVTAVERYEAEAIVSVHPLVNHVMARARRQLGRPEMPLLTVLTDLVDVHRWWACDEVDYYVVGSDVAAGKLYDFGIAPQRISVLGIPLRAEFGGLDVSAREMRQRLGMEPDMTTLLLMGGGDGAGRIPQNARAIADTCAQRGIDFQMVVLTGRNQRARIKVEAQSWPIPTQVFGIVKNVADYMTAADVIATKPGSLTISESLAIGRPLLLGRPLPGQEEGNVPFVVEGGAGLGYRSPAEAAEASAFVLGDASVRWEMSQRAARLSRPRATERTLDLLQGALLRANR